MTVDMLCGGEANRPISLDTIAIRILLRETGAMGVLTLLIADSPSSTILGVRHYVAESQHGTFSFGWVRWAQKMMMIR